MESIEKVSLNTKARRINTVKISIVGTISIVGLALAVYSAVSAEFLFALWYFLAFLFGLIYTVLKINATFPTYIAADDEKLILSSWENGIMPYTLPEKPTFFSDFMPEKIKTDEIFMKDIESVYIGTKRYFERNLAEGKMPEMLKRIGEDKHLKDALKRMDFILILAKNEEVCFMSVTGFDMKGLSNILEKIEKNGAGVQIYTNVAKLLKIKK